jgi:nucleoside-diphosphate-sugar epimerase
MKFLITGGAGFIGSHIVDKLLINGHTVRVIDNFSTGNRENLSGSINKIELLEGDIRSIDSVIAAVKSIDAVIHLAAVPSAERSVIDPVLTTEVNINGTVNILEAARYEKIKRIVFASSAAVYGNNPKLPKHEGMIPNPNTPYAVTKLSGEKFCQVYSELYGLETVILRYFNIFGPRQACDSIYSKVIARFVDAALHDDAPVIYGDGSHSRDFTYVSDAADAAILAATSPVETGQVFNVGRQSQVSINELINQINKLTGKEILPVHENPRPEEIKHSFAYIELIKEKLGYEPKTDLVNGLKQTIDAFKDKQQFS